MANTPRFDEQYGAMRRYRYDDGTVVMVADLGPAGEAAVDVVGDTAIVVVDDEQYEFDLPAGEHAQAFIRNGVLTVEVGE